MSDDPIHNPPAPDTGTRLAYERTFLAHERTQMAWVRTALSLISFGFGIAKFLDYLREQHGDRATLLGPRTVGHLMIMIGLVSLALATIQHRRAIGELRARCPGLPISLATISAGMISLLGILALIAAFLRS